MNIIENSICAPKGFMASGVHCGIRKNKGKKDLALIYSKVPCSAAAVYTTNYIKGAPITVTKENLLDGSAQAIICNSGIANTCNADGIEVAKGMCSLVEEHLGIQKENVIVASTGVIGKPLPLEAVKSGMNQLVSKLAFSAIEAAEAIMTTDTHPKEIAVEFLLNEKPCRIGGIAKGSGMINPNMATMLVFLTTDVLISKEMLQESLRSISDDTFNMISVDGDTSTNDMVSILSNGEAKNDCIIKDDKDYKVFYKALYTVMEYLSKEIAKDGEGATKLISCTVTGSQSKNDAKIIAKSVISSDLLKTAMFGSDANWGRVLCAIGYSSVPVNPDAIDVSFASKKGEITVCKKGMGIDFSEKMAKKILEENEVLIAVNLNSGEFSATAWGCDLSYDYVKINGDYRS